MGSSDRLKGYSARDPELMQLVTGIPGLRSRTPFRPEFTDEEIGGLAVPTLLLVGDHELPYDAQSAVRHARELCPHLQAEIIHGAGHAVNADQPEAVSAKIRAYLGS